MALTEKSIISHFLNRMFSIGVSPKWDEEFNDRLMILNIFTWTCILFCTPYYVIMFAQGNYSIALLFILNQFSYSLSLWLNKFEYYTFSKILILISTNYSVLNLNFTFGYESGFYLYYFTSPLIVYSFFNFRQFGPTVVGLILYVSSYFIANIAYKQGVKPWTSVSPEMIDILYNLNVVLAFSFLIVLASSFSKFHYDASQKINRKNQELEQNKLDLENLVNEKNTLLSETHHRVKNNLAVISGLFDLQLMFEKNEKIKSILTVSKNRIKSMSLIHESLYNQSNVSQIDIRKYVESLTKEIQNSLQQEKSVKIDIEMDSIFFELSYAIPIGLIINEAVTNCFKHAFAQTEHPEITIRLTKTDRYKLCVIDNGTGFDILENTNQNSLGLILIDALSKQLEGKYSFENQDGTQFCLIFG